MKQRSAARRMAGFWTSAFVVCGLADASAQDRLKTMPGYEQFQKMSKEIPGSVKLGTVSMLAWTDSGKALEFGRDGKRWRYDVAGRTLVEAAATTAAAPGSGARGGSGVARGRQVESAVSPDGKLKATHRDRNLWMSDTAGANETVITTDGSARDRIKYGTASWVYGEELRQTSAMWWNPTSTQIAYYRFDEKPVPDYLLQMDQTKLYSTVDTEAYPKAGSPNPVVDLFVYDVAAKKSVSIDVRDGKSFTNDVVGHYVYNVGWSPDGREVTVNRTNRRQNVMEFAACSPATGRCRVVVREAWPASWTANHPDIRWLADKQRFIWGSERTGFKNFYLYNFDGKFLATLTKHPFEVANVVRVDEKAGVLWYMARSGDNHMKLQLHRVGLDGKRDRRLTDPTLHHTISMAPDGRHFVDVAQAHDIAPTTRILDANGKLVTELAASDMSQFNQLGLKPVELFTYKAADGVTELHGMLSKPSSFDPSKQYPVLVEVYAGPGSNGARETFTLPHSRSEYGFLVLSLDSRSASGRGKAFMDAIYMKLGTVEVDDQAAGVRALWQRPYVDRNRVGIYGTSYGGYVSALALLRHPDAFQAAAASSPVTAWDHYDTIYTERYMWIPQENADGYKAGSAMTYADSLKGRLMLYYGTADNNVHPSNAMQLIRALQKAGKSFDVMVGPDQGHSSMNHQRMMEFFIENLVVKPTMTS